MKEAWGSDPQGPCARTESSLTLAQLEHMAAMPRRGRRQDLEALAFSFSAR